MCILLGLLCAPDWVPAWSAQDFWLCERDAGHVTRPLDVSGLGQSSACPFGREVCWAESFIGAILLSRRLASRRCACFGCCCELFLQISNEAVIRDESDSSLSSTLPIRETFYRTVGYQFVNRRSAKPGQMDCIRYSYPLRLQVTLVFAARGGL